MKKKVLFLIESLGGGGAEKVLTTIVKYLNKEMFDVTVCVISGGGRYEDEVAKEVRLFSLMKPPYSLKGLGKVVYWVKYHCIYSWLPMWLVYWLFVPKGNDIEIAFLEGFATKLLASSMNKKAKKIAWVHSDLKNQSWPIMMGVYRNAEQEKAAYCRYDTVVCVSKVVESIMRMYYGLSNTITIYNPIDREVVIRLATKENKFDVDSSIYNIVSVGRLEKVKGFDMLIPVVRGVRNKGVNAHLWIIGEGTEFQNLAKQVKEIGMEPHVTFTGFLKNPYSLMSKMDLFVCSSKAEGFSLVIAEAMILGIPVISMDCSGPKELIGENNVYGTLCNSYGMMEDAIIKQAQVENVYMGYPNTSGIDTVDYILTDKNKILKNEICKIHGNFIPFIYFQFY